MRNSSTLVYVSQVSSVIVGVGCEFGTSDGRVFYDTTRIFSKLGERESTLSFSQGAQCLEPGKTLPCIPSKRQAI